MHPFLAHPVRHRSRCNIRAKLPGSRANASTYRRLRPLSADLREGGVVAPRTARSTGLCLAAFDSARLPPFAACPSGTAGERKLLRRSRRPTRRPATSRALPATGTPSRDCLRRPEGEAGVVRFHAAAKRRHLRLVRRRHGP